MSIDAIGLSNKTGVLSKCENQEAEEISGDCGEKSYPRQDEHILHLNYKLAMQKGETWSMLFEKVAKFAELASLVDYSINQTTLDQVIIEHDLYSSTSQEVQELISPNFASELARNSIFRRCTND
ncbi:hypothetical protein DINM_020008 [Dirofilaria immitis]|nr:hypothetical protein [Dirofilaria immitis]